MTGGIAGTPSRQATGRAVPCELDTRDGCPLQGRHLSRLTAGRGCQSWGGEPAHRPPHAPRAPTDLGGLPSRGRGPAPANDDVLQGLAQHGAAAMLRNPWRPSPTRSDAEVPDAPKSIGPRPEAKPVPNALSGRCATFPRWRHPSLSGRKSDSARPSGGQSSDRRVVALVPPGRDSENHCVASEWGGRRLPCAPPAKSARCCDPVPDATEAPPHGR